MHQFLKIFSKNLEPRVAKLLQIEQVCFVVIVHFKFEKIDR